MASEEAEDGGREKVGGGRRWFCSASVTHLGRFGDVSCAAQ